MALDSAESQQEKGSKVQDEVLLMQGDGLHCVDKLTKAKDAVCFIYCNGGGSLKRGSGFYAIVNIWGTEHRCIVTNNHVIGSREDAAIGVARFHYEGNNSGEEVALDPNILFYTDVMLDYTVVGCNSSVIENSLGISPLEFREEPPAFPGDQIFIFQHPKGNSKQFSYEKISDVKRPFVYYQADTDIGSSGSPVLWKFQLLALHSKGCDRYNKGTLFSEILYHLNHRQSKFSLAGPIVECADNDRKRTHEESQGKENRLTPKKPKVMDALSQEEVKYSLCPSDDDLQFLARECIDYWKHLGRKLHLAESKLKEIHKDNINYDDIGEKAYAMLKAWKELDSSPTFQTLGNALKSLGRNATCRTVCGF